MRSSALTGDRKRRATNQRQITICMWVTSDAANDEPLKRIKNEHLLRAPFGCHDADVTSYTMPLAVPLAHDTELPAQKWCAVLHGPPRYKIPTVQLPRIHALIKPLTTKRLAHWQLAAANIYFFCYIHRTNSTHRVKRYKKNTNIKIIRIKRKKSNSYIKITQEYTYILRIAVSSTVVFPHYYLTVLPV